VARNAVDFVVHGDRVGRAWAGTRRPHAGPGLIDRDFAFHGNKAGNRLQSFRDHGLIMGGTAMAPEQPGRNGHTRAASSATVSVTYRQAVAVPTPEPCRDLRERLGLAKVHQDFSTGDLR
jgi:hypothetical protein